MGGLPFRPTLCTQDLTQMSHTISEARVTCPRIWVPPTCLCPRLLPRLSRASCRLTTPQQDIWKFPDRQIRRHTRHPQDITGLLSPPWEKVKLKCHTLRHWQSKGESRDLRQRLKGV